METISKLSDRPLGSFLWVVFGLLISALQSSVLMSIISQFYVFSTIQIFPVFTCLTLLSTIGYTIVFLRSSASLNQKRQLFDAIFALLFILLLTGTPLIFTSLTRSVFEVNKMLLLRLFCVVSIVFWFMKAIWEQSNPPEEQKRELMESTTVFGFKWRKMGLELPIVAWMGLNVLSTIYSQNVKLSIIGSYDRWEGLITLVSYALLTLIFSKLLTRRFQLSSILITIITAAAFSSVYGVFQSLGIDFMSWSLSPTRRIFACINNPVHFCAYVGMVVPLGIGWLLYLSTRYQHQTDTRWSKIGKWAVFIMTALVFYAQFLSFSRATWIGFIFAMTLFYLLVTDHFDFRSKKNFAIDFFATVFAIGTLYLTAIFRAHLFGPQVSIPIAIIMVIFLAWVWRKSVQHCKDDSESLLGRDELLYWGVASLMSVTFFIEFYEFLSAIYYVPIYIALSGLFIYSVLHLKGAVKHAISRLLVIVLFIELLFVSVSLISQALYLILVWAIYYLILKGNQSLVREKKFWLLSYLIIFLLVIVIPTVPAHLKNAFDLENVKSLDAIRNVLNRTASYKKDAIEGTARTSMWKSSFPWIKDHFLIGSGHDTIKFMYPNYRLPDYGILEGGHNFTPDRLHNEYLNTLASRGVLGFIAYYGFFIITWVLIVLNGLFDMRRNPYRYLVIAFMSGCLVYLGQVMFNFGVVATFVLFYVMLAIALALVTQPTFREIESDDS